MELYQLTYFEALIRRGRYDTAAEELHITTPALMAAVRRTENELGFPLTSRSGKRLIPTPAGEELLRAAENITAELQGLEERLRLLSGEAVTLKIAIEHTAFTGTLVDTLDAFSARHGNVRLELSRRAGSSIRELAARGETDIGIIIRQEEPFPHTATEPYCEAEYGLYCPAGTQQAPRGAVDILSLSGTELRLLNYSGDMAPPLNLFFSAADVSLQRAEIVNIYPDSAIRLIREGLGMGVFPMDLIRMDDRLEVYPFDPPLIMELEFIYAKKRVTRIQRQFMDFLREEAGA